MTQRRRRRATVQLLTGGLIVIAPLGCDNVAWGGTTMSLRPPPSKTPVSPTPALDSENGATPGLPPGELLFAASLSDSTTVVTAVAFVGSSGWAPIPSLDDPTLGPLVRQRLGEIKEITLFTQGTRAGSVLIDMHTNRDPLCPSQPALEGRAELRRDLVDVSRFVATARRDHPPRPEGVAPPPPIRDVRSATLTMAGSQINEVGAVWPPSVMAIRRDIQLFRGGGGVAVAASFLYRDELNQRPAPAGSYSIFVMGEQGPDGVEPTYADFQRNTTEGKWAPRFLGNLDWDDDGADEVLLEVFGDGIRGFRLLDRTPGGFQEVLEVTCGAIGQGTD